MEIGHSRLLKFLLPKQLDSPKMSEQQELRVVYISEPTDVESEVPGQQRLRELPTDANDADKTQSNGDAIDTAKDDDSTFVPVFTTKKEEAVFTKGDMKLQKVSVSEDISNNKIVNPMYSEIHSEVIKDEQPMRTVPTNTQKDEETATYKPRTKIPMLKHKTEKFRQEADANKTKNMPSRQIRRSSIPKLKKVERRSIKDTENKITDSIHKPEGQENIDQEPAIGDNDKKVSPPDEEFDKMFDEIIHNDVEPVLNTSVFIDSFEDAEKLEHSFNEIMHDYEENKIQPIDITQIRRKTPYKKQKSLPEVSFVRKLERRSSLKDIPTNSRDTEIYIITENSKLKNAQTRNKQNRLPENNENVKVLKTKSSNTNTHDPTPRKCDTLNVNKNDCHERNQNPQVLNEKQSIKYSEHKINVEKEMVNETNKFNSNQECVDLPSEHYDTYKNREENVNKTIGTPNTIVDKNSFHTKATDLENEPVEIYHAKTHEATIREKSNESVFESKKTNSTQIPKLLRKVSSLTSKFSSYEKNTTIPSKIQNHNEKPNEKSTISKLSAFDENESNDKTLKDSDDVNNETDLDDKFLLRDTSSKVTDEEDIEDIDTSLVAKIRRDSVEKLKFQRSESIPTEIVNTLNIDHKLSSNNVTPPNTPQVHDYEPYKDSDHLAGEPKILNIDITSDFDDTHKKEYTNSYTVKLQGPRRKTPQFNTTNEHDVHLQNTNTKKLANASDHTNAPLMDTYDQADNNKDQIDFDSPNPDEFSRPPLFEAVNNKINSEPKTKVSVEAQVLKKGNVSKIINKISLTERRPLDTTNKQNVELPLSKPVSTRIAIFERQTSVPSETKPKLKVFLDTKPRIIEEVLKAQPPRQTAPEAENHKSYELKKEIESEEFQPRPGSSVDDDIDNHIFTKSIEHVAEVVEIQDTTVAQVEHNVLSYTSENLSIQDDNNNFNALKDESGVTPCIYEDNKINDTLKGNETLKPQKSNKVSVSKIKEKFKTTKLIDEEVFVDKPRSVAEIDLGDAVKGKVHQMIVRMNSIEKIELEKKLDNINIRERPRKKSVSEKIALFENKKLTPYLENLYKEDFEHVKRLTDNSEPGGGQPKAGVEGAKSAKTSKTPASKSTTTQEVTPAPPTPTPDPTPTSDPTPTPEPTPIPDPTPVPLTDDQRQRIEALQNAKLKYGKMDDIVYIKLGNGRDLPVLFIGTALLDPVLLPHIIGAAIDLGYRGIDTAFIYGNERQIGQAIKAKIDDGTVKREDLFITGKLWSTFHRQDLVEKACSASLEALGLDYFDLYLIHNPMSFKEGTSPVPMIANVLQYSDADYLEAWYGMEGLVEKGLAKGIGLSNFNSEQVAKVVSKGKVKPLVNQVECHPYLSQQRLSQFCADRNVVLQCYGTLGSKNTPAEFKDNQHPVIEDSLVRVLAAGLNITPAQLLLRYQMECGHSVVTKCASADHLWDNIQANKITLGSAQVDALHALNRNKRTYTFRGMGDTHRNYPFKIPF